MQILVLGNGAHTNKRILPALKKIPFIKSVYVGDRHTKKINKIDDVISLIKYEDAFKMSNNFDLTIIATPPYNHIESLKKIYSKREYPIVNLDYKNFKRRDDIKIRFNN